MKYYKDLLFNIGYIFILNIVFSILIFKSISLFSILFFLIEGISFGIIFKLISSISKNNKINKGINIFLITFSTLVFVGQFVHYNFYSCFFSFYSLFHSAQILGFVSAIIKIIFANIWGFLILLCLIPIGIIFIVKINFVSNKRKNIKEFIGLMINIILFLVLTFFINSGIYSYHNLLYKTNDQILNIKKMGLLTSEIIDLNRYIFGFNSDIDVSNNETYTYKKDDDTLYNVRNINFSNLIKNENNEEIKSIYKYFKTQTPSNKNDYTGIFKDKNLIFVTAESLDFSIIDKDITPTLYKLNSEGITFNNFYTPIYYASTSDGEYATLTGLLPEYGTWSFIKSEDNTYPYNLSNSLNKYGYVSSYYHNGIYNFYNRNKVSKNFGFTNYSACGQGLENKINCDLWPQSDYDMLDVTFDDYKENKRFFTYYMTISTHLSHNFDNNDIAIKWQEKVNKLNYSDNVKAYIASVIELDKALENLIYKLKKNNLLESTVIVITPDHFPYGLSKNEIKEFKNLNNEYDLHKSGLIIYNSVTNSDKIDKYSSNIDILPTLLNMFGISYDSRFFIGQDIMSDKDGIVIFNDRSFLTDKGYFDQNKNKFSNKKISFKYVENKQLEVYNKVNISGKMLEFNYYKYLNK